MISGFLNHGKVSHLRTLKELVRCVSASTSTSASGQSRSYSIDTVYEDLQNILQKTNIENEQDNKQPSISRSTSILEQAAQDASSYQVELPQICIIPNSTSQISECVKYCYENNVPMTPVGARTGLEGGIHAIEGGVSFDLSQMKQLLQVNGDDLDCYVEAGLSWRELNDHLRSSSLWFPVDPGASASLGGMSSTSASGTNAVKFGTMRENVIGLEMVVKDGSIINTAGYQCRSKKSSAGINMTNLFVGSEGTLGIITSIRLRLHALPTCLAVATVAFPSVELAAKSVVQVMQCGLPIARLEFLDQPGVSACYQASKLANLDPERPMLFVELHSLTESGLKDQVDLLEEIFSSHEASKFAWSSRQEERSELWKARHNLHWSILNTKPGHLAIDTDVCVPISKFPQMISETKKLISDYQMSAPIMGHAGDGNFHSVILYDPQQEGHFLKAKQLAKEMARVAIKLEGTVTGEHGIGRGKIELMEEQFDEPTLDTMYTIKRSLDPKNLFNPGKIFKPSRLLKEI